MNNIDNLFIAFNPFLEQVTSNIENSGIDLNRIGANEIDHIGIRTSSSKQYHNIAKSLLGFTGIDFVHSVTIRGRYVSTFKLKAPIIFRNYSIPALELLEPAPEDEKYELGPQHIEMVTQMPLIEIQKLYPHLTWKLARPESHNPELSTKFLDKTAVKFHPISLLMACEIEKSKGITNM